MRLDLQIQAQISSWSEGSRVTKKGWLTRSCVIKVSLQSLCGDFDFPAFSGDGTYLWSWPCIPWQAGVVASFCPGWWLSNFSPSPPSSSFPLGYYCGSGRDSIDVGAPPFGPNISTQSYKRAVMQRLQASSSSRRWIGTGAIKKNVAIFSI